MMHTRSRMCTHALVVVVNTKCPITSLLPVPPSCARNTRGPASVSRRARRSYIEAFADSEQPTHSLAFVLHSGVLEILRTAPLKRASGLGTTPPTVVCHRLTVCGACDGFVAELDSLQ